MAECIFCDIAKKKIPARIVYEDDSTIAFLDITPRSEGMCLVIPKQHLDSFDEDMEVANKTFNVAMLVGKKIKLVLKPMRVFFSVMQVQVPHFHVRVYPVYEDQIPLIENKPLEISEEKLDEIAKKINSVSVTEKEAESKEEVKKEGKPKPKKSEEDKFWLKRHWEVA